MASPAVQAAGPPGRETARARIEAATRIAEQTERDGAAPGEQAVT
ncbi:hypothetical protein ACFY4K_03010 [Streptomyces leeuwenhoekii]